MIKAMPGQVADPYSSTEHEGVLLKLRERLVEALRAVKFGKPARPTWLHGRDWDNWFPLFAVAEAVGWRERAESASLAVVKRPLEDLDLGERLLHDLHALFDGHERMHTEDIIKKLNENEELPWGRLNNGQGLNGHTLANMLSKFEVRPEPKPFRIKSTQARGYLRASFATVWKRYGVE